MVPHRSSRRAKKVDRCFHRESIPAPSRFSLDAALPRPQNTGQASYSQSFTRLLNHCSRQSPLPTPFPIYQLEPRKGTPTERVLLLCGRGKIMPSPLVMKCVVILPWKNQYGLLIHYLKSPKFIISLLL